MTTLHKFQSAVAILILALGVAFVVLNREPTVVNFLFGTLLISRAWLVIGFFAAGLVVGWLAHSILTRVKQAKKNRARRIEEVE